MLVAYVSGSRLFAISRPTTVSLFTTYTIATSPTL